MRELQLLTTLAAHPQRILTRDELYAEVWGREQRRADRSVDVYVSRLRSKLAQALPEQQPDPHPQRDRLPLLRRQLRRPAFHIFFTSALQPGNKLPAMPLRACRRTALLGRQSA